MRHPLAMAAALTLAIASGPNAAHACGGFFCSNVPVDQSGERVLFAVDGGTVNAHIQIFYQGEAEKFAWVLPLPEEPSNIGVGTDMLFTVLQQRTQPSFQLNWEQKDECWYGWGWAEDGDFAAGGGRRSPAPPSEPGVEVLQEAKVGPYDAVVIKGTDASAGAADAVFEWLKDNGYDQPESAKNLIHTYVAEEHVFVAVKLQSDQDTGDIRPLTLEFPFPGSCVPLRLTSIAATDDMDVWVYMLGQDRAVPVNFLHVEINEKLIDWLNWGSNYRDVATDAVDSAAGRAFLTEFAGSTDLMKDVLWQDGLYDIDALLQKETPWEFVEELLMGGFPRTAQMQNLIREFIPKPESLSELNDQEFYNNLGAYQSELADQEFDPVGFVAAIEEEILQPLQDANTLFDTHRYMTRMYTIISPDEMTRDPIFLFNPDLGDVAGMHTATATPYCAEGSNQANKVIVTLADGSQLEYEVDPQTYQPPVLVDQGPLGEPASSVQRMYTAGPPEDVSAESIAAVDAELDTIQIGLITDGTVLPPAPKASGPRSPSAGCTATLAPAEGGVLALVLLLAGAALLAWRRRTE